MLHVNREGKSRLQWDKVQDSANKTAFGTGSMRDTQTNKGRYDLIPTNAILRLAQHYENGARKYAERNWEKGQPLYQYYNSAIRHLEHIKDADISEDHLAAALWNVAAMIHHIDKMLDGELPIELDSFGIVKAIRDYETFEKIREYSVEATQTFPSRIPFIASGVMPENLPRAFDADRFKARELPVRRFRTDKLDPEELG